MSMVMIRCDANTKATIRETSVVCKNALRMMCLGWNGKMKSEVEVYVNGMERFAAITNLYLL